jgi:hypothetical protein
MNKTGAWLSFVGTKLQLFLVPTLRVGMQFGRSAARPMRERAPS